MNSNSQSGQDIFVRLVFGRNFCGRFLDIGCCHPVDISNTYQLELEGWGGVLIDQDKNAIDLCKVQRLANSIHADATTFDYRSLGDECFDYVSLDVDAASLLTLEQVLKCGVEASVWTIEHDAYRFGDEPRREMRKLMKNAGYYLLCSDVKNGGCPYEDWWIKPIFFPTLRKFECDGHDWEEIVGEYQ